MFVKICGITSVADAVMAARAGANAIGLNFYRPSPRFVQLGVAREIVQALPPYVDAVGVFVNATTTKIRRIAGELGLRSVQLHGDVTSEAAADLHDYSVIATVGVEDESSIAAVLALLSRCDQAGRLPSAVLADAHRPGMFGGTGVQAPWYLARRLVETSRVPVTLAGGLTPKNVAEAIRTVRPWGVDVASGVEVAPGRKEPYKVARFIAAAHEGFRS